MSPQQIAVLVVAATLGLLVVLLVLYGRPQRTRQEPLPPNWSRGDPDSVLEGPRLHRMQVWGVASSIFITAFLIVYFVAEPFRAASYEERFRDASVTRGEHEFNPVNGDGANCAQCHGPTGEGGFAATDPEWPAPPLNNVMGRLTRDELMRITRQGRPGTPMPAWGIEFGGPLNEQVIDDIANYVESIQLPPEERWELPPEVTDGREVFVRKCAVCHGSNAEGHEMGQPIPAYFAPDLVTEFYRLGLRVMRLQVTTELRNELLAQHADVTEPTEEEVNAALAAVPLAAIMEAGEEASRDIIMRGRPGTPMPPWQARIMPEHIDAVIDYLRTIQTTGPVPVPGT